MPFNTKRDVVHLTLKTKKTRTHIYLLAQCSSESDYDADSELIDADKINVLLPIWYSLKLTYPQKNIDQKL